MSASPSPSILGPVLTRCQQIHDMAQIHLRIPVTTDSKPSQSFIDSFEVVDQLWKKLLPTSASVKKNQADAYSNMDRLFMTRCMLLCCVEPKARRIQSDSTRKELMAKLSCMSCRHDRSEPYPTDDEIKDLEYKVSGFLVANRYKEEKIEKDNDDCEQKISQIVADKKNKLCRDVTGLLFSDQSVLFLYRASRFFYTVHLEKDIRDRCQTMPVVNFTAREQQRVNDWLKGRVKIEASDLKRRTFENIYEDSCIPAGGRLDKMRRPQGSDIQQLPVSILEVELGVKHSTEITKLADDSCDDDGWEVVAEDPTGPLYDSLLLTIFDFTMNETVRFKLRGDGYFIPTSELPFRHEEFNKARREGLPRRPMLTRIANKWMIHMIAQKPTSPYVVSGRQPDVNGPWQDHEIDRVEGRFKEPEVLTGWYYHDTLTDALLNWVKIVKEQFGGMLDTGTTPLPGWALKWIE